MNTSRPQPLDQSEDARQRCIYCLQNGHLRDTQIVLRGRRFYLCAPRGQIIEGHLVIAPFDCIGSMSRLPHECFREIDHIKKIVAHFHNYAYGVDHTSYYEQGRAGGGATIDAVGGFPHHAHLCCLPAALNLHSVLATEYVQKSVSGLSGLAAASGTNPYLYFEGINGNGNRTSCVYLARSAEGRAELERYRLRPVIAALCGVPERGRWTAYPGDCELERATQLFSAFRHCQALTSIDQQWRNS